MTAHDDILGPVNYLIVEFPDLARGADGFARLLEITHSGTVAVLDLEFFAVSDTGTPTPLVASQLGARVGLDLADFDGANSSLLTDDDRAQAAGNAAPGSIIAVLVWEDLSLVSVLAEWESSGATILGEGPVLPDDLIDAIDATETPN
jgi:hypothetical protein